MNTTHLCNSQHNPEKQARAQKRDQEGEANKGPEKEPTKHPKKQEVELHQQLDPVNAADRKGRDVLAAERAAAKSVDGVSRLLRKRPSLEARHALGIIDDERRVFLRKSASSPAVRAALQNIDAAIARFAAWGDEQRDNRDEDEPCDDEDVVKDGRARATRQRQLKEDERRLTSLERAWQGFRDAADGLLEQLGVDGLTVIESTADGSATISADAVASADSGDVDRAAPAAEPSVDKTKESTVSA